MAQELKKNALGLVHSVALGVAGSSPSFSLSATLSTLIAAVGVLAPASLVYCGLIMTGIVLAYQHLNARDPNAGAAYAWGSAMLGRVPGFMAGWALLVATAVFMVSATVPAGSATLMLVAPDLADDQIAITACAAAWVVAITVILVKGISLAGWVQSIMTAVEMAIMIAITLSVLVEFGPQAAHRLSWHDLSPFAFSPGAFASGAVIALFFFWGWDVSLNLSEETRDADKAPGLGALAAIVALILVFGGFAAVSLMVLDDEAIKQSVTGIVFAVADKVFPRPWSYLAVLALMLSTIGTLQCNMLQFTRTMFALSRDGALHSRWSALHESWRTPYVATVLIGALGLLLLFASIGSQGIAEVMSASINIIGVLAAYYYGIAGLACAIAYRRALRQSPGAALGKVIWPALSAFALFWAGVRVMEDFDRTTTIIAVGSMALGAVPLLRHRRREAVAAE